MPIDGDSLTREQAAESIMVRVDMMARGLFDPKVELKPVRVTVNGKQVVVLILTCGAWDVLQEILLENGCNPIPEYVS